MRPLIILGTSWLYAVFSSALLARLFDPGWLPSLALVWVTYLAEEPAPTPSRASAVFSSNLAYAVALGYLDGRFALAPHFLLVLVYGLALTLQRVLGTQQPGNRAVTFLSVMAVVAGSKVALWWLKGLIIHFASLPPLAMTQLLVNAILSGVLAVLLFPRISQYFQGSDSGYARRLS